MWAGLRDPEPDEVTRLGTLLGVHELAIEDAVKGAQRPKIERYGDWLVLVMRSARYDEASERLDTGDVHLMVRADAVVMVQRGLPDPLADVCSRLASDATSGSQPIGLLYTVLDAVVDGYGACLVGLDDDVNEVELAVFADHRVTGESGRIVARLYFLQRETLQLHRAVRPLLSVFPELRADGFVARATDWSAYLRDVADHLARQADELQSLREVLNAALGANATQVSLRQNEDMRKISAWAGMAAVPTLIAGIYGMNFEKLPELHWDLGYPMAIGIMAAAVLLIYRRFKRSGWL